MTSIKFKTYNLIEKAIEEGIEYGWRKSHKYEDTPPDEHLKQQLLQAIMVSLDEIIDFNDE